MKQALIAISVNFIKGYVYICQEKRKMTQKNSWRILHEEDKGINSLKGSKSI